MRGNRFRSILWVLALTIIVLLSYWKIVFTKQFSIVWQWEMVSQYYAWDTYAAANVHKGIVPLWDPFRYGGTSFTGEMQTGLFYPFKLALYRRSMKMDCYPNVLTICSTFLATGWPHFRCSFSFDI
jgi:hypothetical protein